jgi:ribosomal protein L11 methyltransferase
MKFINKNKLIRLTFTYTKIIISSTDEILLAIIANDFPIESIEEQEDESFIYIKTEDLTTEIKTSIEDICKEHNAIIKYEAVQDQNWNEVWESNFTPVEVENFCRIRAEFHDSIEGFEHEIVIQPKMAFGTGHHNTTYMMIREMHELDFKNSSVFDYGCGTGILAIYAGFLGASDIDAVDIENESYLNTIENSERNNVNFIKAYEGDINATPVRPYDYILANINRNILLNSVESLEVRSHKNTILLLSGILEQDKEIILNSYASSGWQLLRSQQKGDWLQLTMKKNINI